MIENVISNSSIVGRPPNSDVLVNFWGWENLTFVFQKKKYTNFGWPENGENFRVTQNPWTKTKTLTRRMVSHCCRDLKRVKKTKNKKNGTKILCCGLPPLTSSFFFLQARIQTHRLHLVQATPMVLSCNRAQPPPHPLGGRLRTWDWIGVLGYSSQCASRNHRRGGGPSHPCLDISSDI